MIDGRGGESVTISTGAWELGWSWEAGMARLGLWLFVLLLSLPAGLFGQVATGTMVGVVEDATGSVVPNARITAVHTATTDKRQVPTNERGEFNIPYARIGEYSVTVEAQGFKRKTLTGIVIRVDQTVNLRVPVEIGAVTESVEVTSAAPLIDTATSSLGQVIDNKKVLNLPLNGRNTFALGLLAGNTVPMTGMGSNLPFVASGGRFGHNDVQLDGVDNNTSATGGAVGAAGIGYIPSVDAIEEFKVKTNNFSAEFGRSAGAIITATIKSGSNDAHGSVFEFLRNEKLDANSFFSNAGRVPRQPFKQNQFGFTLGGPLEIPRLHHGRNRTFFFGDYEGKRRRTSASSSLANLPPTAFRRGDFSRYNRRIYDPRARQRDAAGRVVSTPLLNNTLPASLIDPAAAATLALVPEPNFGPPDAEARNYLRIAPRRLQSDQFDVKIDHRLGDKNTMFGRFSLSNATNPGVGSFDGWLGGASNGIDNARSAVLSDTHIFGPTLVNEVRFGFLRTNSSTTIPGIHEGVAFARQQNVATFPFPIQFFPSINFPFSGDISGQVQFNAIGGATPTIAIQNTFHWADNVSLTWGNHNLKFGGELRRYRFDRITGGGGLYFGAIFSASSDVPNSGAPLADFLAGFPSRADGNQQLDWNRVRDIYGGAYVQDDWKLTPQLTLNLGLRYELYTQPVDARDRGGLYDIATRQIAIPGKNGYTRAIVDGDHNNISPRFGFAYALTRKFTIRAGTGVFYARRDQNTQVTHIGANIPNVPLVAFPVISATDTLTPPVTIHTPLQVNPLDPTFSLFTPRSPLAFTFRTPDFHNVPNPYVYQWNLALEYELARDLAVAASYSGSKGSRLVNRRNLNQIPIELGLAGFTGQADRYFPNINGTMGYDAAIGISNYNALNLRLEKRVGSGLDFLLNYTWSKALDNGGGTMAWAQNGGTTIPLDSYNVRKERSYGTLDVPHVFVASYGYELPFGPRKPWLSGRGPVAYLFGGWQVNGITALRSGFVTDIRSTRVAGNNQLFATTNVPDMALGQSIYLPNRSVDGFFNPAAFTEPIQLRNTRGVPITVFGNAARRVGRGPGSVNFDFSLFKNFPIGERAQAQFRAEAFNISNTPTFFLPSANNSTLAIGNQGFGKLSSSSATGRQIQFGLKFSF